MRILYIHQYFKSPEEGGAIRSYYLATALAQAGHEVILITSHNGKNYEEREIQGVKVHYLPVFYRNELNSLQRSRAFLSFIRQARSFVDRFAPYDLCYASSTPLTVGLLALYAKQRFKTPYLFEVRDLWPEAPIQLGYIRNPVIKKSLRRLESLIYAKAEALVALSPGIVKGIQAVNPTKGLHLIPNMADCRFFKPEAKNYSFAKIFGLENVFVIGYFGAAGPANHLRYLLDAARACQQQKMKVSFLIAASGSQLEEIKEQTALSQLQNLVFVPYGSKQQLKNYLSIVDAVYTSFGPYPVLQTNSPNKFFDGLAAGKLSIVNTKGWLKELTEENRCGFYANPEDPSAFVAALKPFMENHALLEEYQQNARHLAKAHFSREELSKKFIRMIEKEA